jgi:hypothetical protein
MSSTPLGPNAPEPQPAPPQAPQPGVIPLRPLSFSEIIGGAFATLRRYPKVLFGTALVAVGVPNVVSYLVSWVMLLGIDPAVFQPGVPNAQRAAAPVAILVASLVGAVLAIMVLLAAEVVIAGFTTIVVSQAVLGKDITVGEAWERLRARMWPLVGVTVLYIICVFAGTILCLVPGVWVGVLFALATPALVLEQVGVGQAFQRSKVLMRDAWWQTFGILVVTWLVVSAFSLIIQLPLSFAGSATSFLTLDAGTPQSPSLGMMLVALAAEIFVGTVTYPFIAAVTALLYIDRRIVRERLDLQLAEAAA